MFYDLEQIIQSIPESENRLYVRNLIARQEATINTIVDERNYLRQQVSLALRSIKFDLHPELPL